MIARLAAGDDSLGSTTVTVLLLLYIGPDLLRHKNGRLAKIVCFQQRMWVSLDSASSKCFVFRIICILWLNVTFDAVTQFSFFQCVSAITLKTGVDWPLPVTTLVLMICLLHLTQPHYCLFTWLSSGLGISPMWVCMRRSSQQKMSQVLNPSAAMFRFGPLDSTD